MTTQAPPDPPNATYAGFVSRSLAFVIDLVLIALGVAVGLLLIALAQWFFTSGPVSGWGGLDDLLSRALGAAAAVLAALASIAYFVGFWSLIGVTPGKALLGLQVLRGDGRRLSVGRSLLRYVGYWISALPLFLGFAWILVSRRHQGWHDRLADTVVVYTHAETREGP